MFTSLTVITPSWAVQLGWFGEPDFWRETRGQALVFLAVQYSTVVSIHAMKTISAALIGLALAGNASAAIFAGSPVVSPFPDQPSWQQPQRWANPIPPPAQYQQPQQGGGFVVCQRVEPGTFYCSR